MYHQLNESVYQHIEVKFKFIYNSYVLIVYVMIHFVLLELSFHFIPFVKFSFSSCMHLRLSVLYVFLIPSIFSTLARSRWNFSFYSTLFNFRVYTFAVSSLISLYFTAPSSFLFQDFREGHYLYIFPSVLLRATL